MQELIVREYLDDLSRFFLALTCSEFFAKYRVRMRADKLERWISKILGRFGTIKQLNWFVGDGWTGDFRLSIRSAIRKPNIPFLSKLKVKHAYHVTFSHQFSLNIVQCKYEGNSYSWDAGIGGIEAYDYLRKQRFQMNEYYVSKGAAYSGNLELLKRIFSEFQIDDVGWVFSGAAFAGRTDAMELIYNQCRVRFNSTPLTEEESQSQVGFNIVDEVEIAQSFAPGYANHLLAYYKFLESKKVSLKANEFVKSALHIRALDAIVYLEANYGAISNLDTPLLTENINSIFHHGFDVSILDFILKTRPSIVQHLDLPHLFHGLLALARDTAEIERLVTTHWDVYSRLFQYLDEFVSKRYLKYSVVGNGMSVDLTWDSPLYKNQARLADVLELFWSRGVPPQLATVNHILPLIESKEDAERLAGLLEKYWPNCNGDMPLTSLYSCSIGSIRPPEAFKAIMKALFSFGCPPRCQSELFLGILGGGRLCDPPLSDADVSELGSLFIQQGRTVDPAIVEELCLNYLPEQLHRLTYFHATFTPKCFSALPVATGGKDDVSKVVQDGIKFLNEQGVKMPSNVISESLKQMAVHWPLGEEIQAPRSSLMDKQAISAIEAYRSSGAEIDKDAVPVLVNSAFCQYTASPERPTVMNTHIFSPLLDYLVANKAPLDPHGISVAMAKMNSQYKIYLELQGLFRRLNLNI